MIDTQTAKFIARISENLPSNLDRATMQMWIESPKELKKFLSRLSLPVWVNSPQGLQNFLSGLCLSQDGEDVFTLTVEYSKSLSEIISAGKYDYVNDSITENNFPYNSLRGVVEVETRLFHFDRKMTSEEVIVEIEKAGYKPADLPTLCAFGAKYSEIQRKFPVVALNSVWRNPDGDRDVPCLGMWDGERRLRLSWFGGRWLASYWFLAVRS